MGIDACIYCKTRDGEAPALQDALPNVVQVDSRFFSPDGATHEVENHWRYYGPYYERGPWPEISAVLSALLAAPNVETVWYFGDVDVGEPGADRPFTTAKLRQFDELYARRVRP